MSGQMKLVKIIGSDIKLFRREVREGLVEIKWSMFISEDDYERYELLVGRGYTMSEMLRLGIEAAGNRESGGT